VAGAEFRGIKHGSGRNTEGPPDLGIVDGHVHLTGERSAGGLTAEDYVRQMDAAGIGRSVVATSTRQHGFDNAPAADAAGRFPGRLATVGAIDVLAPGAADALGYWVRERGLRGMRCSGGSSADADGWLGDERCARVFARAASLGTVVSAQRTRISTVPPLTAAGRPYPGLRFVVYSAAAPAVGESGRSADVDVLARLAAVDGCDVSVSVANARATFSAAAGYSRFFEVLCERFGVQRVAWGSYSMFTGAEPHDSLGSVLAEMRASFSFLSPGELSRVPGRTAAQLFWP
jgi:predicted TIM-barrel fold metal-dependent hydrolase